MEKILSCDWGTSAFRLRLVETAGLQIVAEVSAQQGIAATHRQWAQSGKAEAEKMDFYLSVLSGFVKAMEDKTETCLDGVPIIISGMVSSTIGMIDLPYRQLPVAAAGTQLIVREINETGDFKHKVIIVSGLRTEDDVMRGEETKLAGSAGDAGEPGRHLYIFTGTHPKHVVVENGLATHFKTYMTGEFFELLSQKSILSVSVKDSMSSADYWQSFEKGVRDSADASILHSCFLVRTNQLFAKLTPEENYYYLSGVLVGAELRDIGEGRTNITLVGSTALAEPYCRALAVLNLPGNNCSLSVKDADEALVKGQVMIYDAFKSRAS